MSYVLLLYEDFAQLFLAISDFFNRDLLLGTILAFIGGMLCAGGGIGGGGIYIPVFILVLGMSAHEAIPLSKVFLFPSLPSPPTKKKKKPKLKSELTGSSQSVPFRGARA